MASSNFIGLKLHPERDADILAAIDDAPDKSARLRELIREGLSVKRKTLNGDGGVLRKTVTVKQSPQPISAENPPAGSDNGKPSQFVPPLGFWDLPKSEQNKIKEAWFAEQKGNK